MEDKLMVVDCRDPKHPYPRPLTKPLLLPVPLQMPFLDLESQKTGGSESQIALAQLLRHEMGATKKDLVEIDKLLLKHINTAISSDQQVKAQDLCTSLGLAQSMDLAVKIAGNANKSHLVERIQVLIQARQSSQVHRAASIQDEKGRLEDTLMKWEEEEGLGSQKPAASQKKLSQAKINSSSSSSSAPAKTLPSTQSKLQTTPAAAKPVEVAVKAEPPLSQPALSQPKVPFNPFSKKK